MTLGDAFAGFDEEIPAFPPTYKRNKADRVGLGLDGGCGDYSDIADLLKGFSHTGAEEEEEGSSRPVSTHFASSGSSSGEKRPSEAGSGASSRVLGDSALASPVSPTSDSPSAAPVDIEAPSLELAAFNPSLSSSKTKTKSRVRAILPSCDFFTPRNIFIFPLGIFLCANFPPAF